MIQICAECGEETSCPTCNNFKPSWHLLKELSVASEAIGKLGKRFDVAKNFIRKIVHDWECDPNHAEAILNELERMDK